MSTYRGGSADIGFWRMMPSNSPTVGRFWMPENPICFKRSSKSSRYKGPYHLPASTSVCLTIRQHLSFYILHDSLAFLASNPANRRGHAVTARVINDVRSMPPDSSALAERPVPAPPCVGTDGRSCRGSFQQCCPFNSGHYVYMISLNACTVACANAGLLICASTSISARFGADRQPDRMAKNNASSASSA